ncbi:MAG: mandelate racemase/muconate lactonizing enzyme family protein [Armatimonadota bacterium]
MIEVEPILLQIPLDEPLRLRASQDPASSLTLCLVRVSSDDATSYGEALLEDPYLLAETVDFFADAVANGNPRDFGLLWQRMMGLVREYEPEPLHDFVATLGAIDTALWDLAGRALGVPCYQLAGGARARQVDCYASGLFADDPELAEKTRQLRRRFATIELTLCGNLEQDIAAIKALRRSAGDQAPLLVDGDGQYEDLEQAKAIAQALEQVEGFWFAEPLPIGRWDDYRGLRTAVAPALAADKHLFDLRDYQRALQAEALDVAVGDVRVCGGMSGAHRLAQLAWLHGARTTFHCALSPLARVAAAHLVAANANAGPLQVRPKRTPLMEMVEPVPFFENGFLKVPQEPGLGIQVSEEFISKYRVELPEDE